MNRRADRRTGGIFPDLERPDDERYAAERQNRPWTPGQEVALVVAVCACPNANAYTLMAPELMAALGHEPVYGPDAKPSLAKHQSTCIRALELRLVTKMVGKYEGWTPHDAFEFADRTGRTLSWGERAKIVRPYLTKVEDNSRRLDFAELCRLLGRRHSGRHAVGSYLEWARKNRNAPDKEEPGDPPVGPENRESVRRLTDRLDAAADAYRTRRDVKSKEGRDLTLAAAEIVKHLYAEAKRCPGLG